MCINNVLHYICKLFRKKKKAKKSGVFRYGKKKLNAQHPLYVTKYNSKNNMSDYVSITHSSRVKGIDYIRLNKNPNPADCRIAYRSPTIETTNDNNIDKRVKKGWQFSAKDKKSISKLVKSQKKGNKKR